MDEYGIDMQYAGALATGDSQTPTGPTGLKGARGLPNGVLLSTL